MATCFYDLSKKLKCEYKKSSPSQIQVEMCEKNSITKQLASFSQKSNEDPINYSFLYWHFFEIWQLKKMVEWDNNPLVIYFISKN
jgi:hypothetical protein